MVMYPIFCYSLKSQTLFRSRLYSTVMWIDVHSLPETNPLRRTTSRISKFYNSYRSPLHQVAQRLKDIPVEELETIEPFALAPWQERVKAIATQATEGEGCAGWTVGIAVSSSARNGIVGVGGAIQTRLSEEPESKREVFSFTLGSRADQNPYSSEMAAIAYALRHLPVIRDQNVALFTRNKGIATTLGKPLQQSGQEYLRCIYEEVEKLRERNNSVVLIWDCQGELELLQKAKQKAKEATHKGREAQARFPKMKSTILNIEKGKLKLERSLPEGVGKHSKEIDAALPGQHTLQIYNEWSWKERSILGQLRTDMARLNGYLYRIRAEASPECVCGNGIETVEHFLFHCPQWDEEREELERSTNAQRNSLSFCLGGKSPSDGPDWKPNMAAIRATIQFTLATGRFKY